MTRSRTGALAVALATAGGFSLWLSRSTAEDDRAGGDVPKLVESARETLDAYQTMYRVGQATAEDVYQWSRRLMEAELLGDSTNVVPAKDHRERMRALHRRAETLNRAGGIGGEQHALTATAFYLAEASVIPGE